MSYSECKCERPKLEGDLWCRSCGGLAQMGKIASEMNKIWLEKEANKQKKAMKAEDIRYQVDQFTRKGRKICRNDVCPCLSGKKYKHCCGRN